LESSKSIYTSWSFGVTHVEPASAGIAVNSLFCGFGGFCSKKKEKGPSQPMSWPETDSMYRACRTGECSVLLFADQCSDLLQKATRATGFRLVKLHLEIGVAVLARWRKSLRHRHPSERKKRCEGATGIALAHNVRCIGAALYYALPRPVELRQAVFRSGQRHQCRLSQCGRDSASSTKPRDLSIATVLDRSDEDRISDIMARL